MANARAGTECEIQSRRNAHRDLLARPFVRKEGGKLVTLGHYVFPSFYPYVLPSRAAWALPHGAYVGARTSPLFWCALSHTQHGPKRNLPGHPRHTFTLSLRRFFTR